VSSKCALIKFKNLVADGLGTYELIHPTFRNLSEWDKSSSTGSISPLTTEEGYKINEEQMPDD